MIDESEPGSLLSLEALTAVHGLVSAGLEGDLGLLAASIADHLEVLAGSTVAGGGALVAAALEAAGGLVLESALREERLLGSREDEFAAAVTAGQGFVLVHGGIPS